MYVEAVTMESFRCFERAEATFIHPGTGGLPKVALPNVTLLVGVNGVGKTSVLKAVALSVLAPIRWELGYRPYYLVNRAKTAEEGIAYAQIKARFGPWERDEVSGHYGVSSFHVLIHRGSDEEKFTVALTPGGGPWEAISDSYGSSGSPSYFLLGYGASRRTEYLENLDSQRSRRRHPRFQRVAGLFEEFITLYPLAAWFFHLPVRRANEVEGLLNDLLPQDTRFAGEFRDAEAIFEHRGIPLPFGALSDGYRSYIGLVADMLYHLNHVCPGSTPLTDLAGIVMVDDIDIHLHPAWQREVVPKLARTFPKLQFILTSHSPLVAGTLHAANIRVIEGDTIRELDEKIDGLSADQILLSSYFGHVPPRSPEAVQDLNNKAARVADTGDPAAAIEFLNELAGKGAGKRKK